MSANNLQKDRNFKYYIYWLQYNHRIFHLQSINNNSLLLQKIQINTQVRILLTVICKNSLTIHHSPLTLVYELSLMVISSC